MPSSDSLQNYFCIQLRQSARLAVPLTSVAEVMTVGWEEICPIPGVTPALLGVVNQHGQLLWVLELADLLTELLGLSPSPINYGKWNRLTLLAITSPNNATNGETLPRVGCVVSALKGIVSLNSEEFKPIPASFSPAFSSFLSGFVEIEDYPVAILNVSAMFAALQIVQP